MHISLLCSRSVVKALCQDRGYIGHVVTIWEEGEKSHAMATVPRVVVSGLDHAFVPHAPNIVLFGVPNDVSHLSNMGHVDEDAYCVMMSLRSFVTPTFFQE